MRLSKIKLIIVVGILILGSAIEAQTMDWTKKGNPLNNQVNGVAFRADGQKVLSGTSCHPASIRMFDVVSSNLEWDYTVGHDYMCIMGVTFSSNQNYIAAIEEFGNIFVFDNTGSSPVIVDTINTGTSYGFATAVSPSNDKIAVACSNGKLKIYNLPGGTLAHDINAHLSFGYVTAVAYSPDGSKIVTGGSDDKVKIWTNTGTLLFTCTGHTGDITCVRVTPNNNYVVSASADDKIKIWDITTGTLVRTISGHTGDVNSIDISPDGTKIVSGSADKTCKIWDLNTGNELSTFGVPDSGAVLAVAWSPLGNKIVTGNEKSDVTLWSTPVFSHLNSIRNISFEFTLYPNPASDKIYLHFPQNTSIDQIIIYDPIGKVVFTSQQAVKEIPIHHLPAGSYFIGVQIGDKKVVKPFMKQ